MPGGWKGDKVNVFKGEGLTDMQNEAYQYMRTLLQWRKGNEVISKGTMKHFMPRNGVYVYERRYGDKSAVVILNGVSKDNELSLEHYREILRDKKSGRDVITGRKVNLDNTLKLSPKEVLILEL